MRTESRGSYSPAARLAQRLYAVGVGTVLAAATVAAARAELAPAFADKITVDTGYVTGVSSPTDIAFSGDGRAVVTLKTGQIVVRRADGTLNVVAYPFPGTLDTASEKGLLGVVADPDVARNGAFYFYVSNGPTNDKHRVYRAVLTESDSFVVDTDPVVAASRNVGPGLEGPANHDGGGMVIYNRQLYIGVGDTGSNASPPVNKYASCLNKGNGKILHVNLDGSWPSAATEGDDGAGAPATDHRRRSDSCAGGADRPCRSRPLPTPRALAYNPLRHWGVAALRIREGFASTRLAVAMVRTTPGLARP